MRWLFLFVLSLNLAYITWEMSKAPSHDYAEVPALNNVETIVLLRELKQSRSESTGPESEIGGDGVNTADAAKDSQSDAAHTDAVQSAVTEKMPETNPAVISEAKSSQAEPTNLADSASPTVTADASAQKSGVGDAMPAESSQAAGCYSLGPFRDLDKLRGLTREIKSYVIKTDFRGKEEAEPTLFWVYLAPEASRRKAIETGERLKAKKIKDFYVIREGEKENGLSLGHFRNKKRAYALAKKVTALGFNTNVEPVYKTYTAYWLDYELAAGVVIPETVFDKYIGTGGKGKISRLSRDCGV